MKKPYTSRTFIPEEEIGKKFAEHNANFPKHLRKNCLTLSYGEAKKILLKGNWEPWSKCFMVRLAKNYQPKPKS